MRDFLDFLIDQKKDLFILSLPCIFWGIAVFCIVIALSGCATTLDYNIRCATGIYVKESGTQTYDVTVAYSRE